MSISRPKPLFKLSFDVTDDQRDLFAMAAAISESDFNQFLITACTTASYKVIDEYTTKQK